MKSVAVHCLNRFPGGHCEHDDQSLRAYDAAGKLRVCMQKNGAGQWVDRSEEFGLPDRHDLSPMPKEARAWKLYADGRIAKSEEYEERAVFAEAMVKEHGKILSEVEFEKLKKAVK